MIKDTIFTEEERAQIIAMIVSALKLSAASPMLVVTLLLNILVAVFVLGFEYELGYQVFYSLAGDNHQYWTPSIMALSSLIIVLGFHYLAQQKLGKHSRIFIERVVAAMMPLYLLGIGLVIAALLYNDGLRGLLESEEAVFFVDAATTAASEDDWLNTLMADFTSPVAALAFSMGIGSLAILNVFVAHSAMNVASVKAAELTKRRSQTHKIEADYAELEQAEKDYAQTLAELNTLLLMDKTAIQNDIASDVFAELQDQLMPVRVWLNEQKTRSDKPAFLPDISLNPKQIETELKTYNALGLEDLIGFMNAKPNPQTSTKTEKSS